MQVSPFLIHETLTYPLHSACETQLQFSFILNVHLSHFSLKTTELYYACTTDFLNYSLDWYFLRSINTMHTMGICEDMDRH
jgi:hypothetical protein